MSLRAFNITNCYPPIQPVNSDCFFYRRAPVGSRVYHARTVSQTVFSIGQKSSGLLTTSFLHTTTYLRPPDVDFELHDSLFFDPMFLPWYKIAMIHYKHINIYRN